MLFDNNWSLSVKGFRGLMDNINRVTQDYGMKINVQKTKVIHISERRRKDEYLYQCTGSRTSPIVQVCAQHVR